MAHIRQPPTNNVVPRMHRGARGVGGVTGGGYHWSRAPTAAWAPLLLILTWISSTIRLSTGSGVCAVDLDVNHLVDHPASVGTLVAVSPLPGQHVPR